MKKIKVAVYPFFLLISIMLSINLMTNGQTSNLLEIQVDAHNVTHQMKGGIGAPENEAYYGFAMLTRFLGKYASVLSVKSDKNIDGLLTTAYKNNDGNLQILLVNNNAEAVSVDVVVENSNTKQAFYLYQVNENMVKVPGFILNPQTTFKNSEKLKNIQLLPESITVLTSNNLKNGDFGVIE